MRTQYVTVLCVLFFCLNANPAYAENYAITINCSDVLDATIDSALKNQYVPKEVKIDEVVYYVTYRLAPGKDEDFYSDYNAHKEFNRYIYIEDHLILVMTPVPVDIPGMDKVGEIFSFSSAEKAADHIQNVCPGMTVHIKQPGGGAVSARISGYIQGTTR